MMPTSFVEPRSPVPVLPPTRQSGGSPARKRLPPVLHASSQSVSCCPEEGFSAPPRTSLRMSSTIADGVVVSRGSPGSDSFTAGSFRSRRVTGSPSERANSVTAAGPPRAARMRLPAVLSLSVIAASQSSASVMPSPPTCMPVVGEYSTRSPFVNTTRRSSLSFSASTRASTAADASSLKVLHIGKRSSARYANRAPVPVSRIATPRAFDPRFDALHFSRKNFGFRFREVGCEQGGARKRAAYDKAAPIDHDFPSEDLKFETLLRPLDRFHDEALCIGRIQPLGEFHPFSFFEILVVLEEMRGLLAHDGREIAVAHDPGEKWM